MLVTDAAKSYTELQILNDKASATRFGTSQFRSSKDGVIFHPENTRIPAERSLRRSGTFGSPKASSNPPLDSFYSTQRIAPFSLSILFPRESALLSVSLPWRTSTITTRVSDRVRSIRTILENHHSQQFEHGLNPWTTSRTSLRLRSGCPTIVNYIRPLVLSLLTRFPTEMKLVNTQIYSSTLVSLHCQSLSAQTTSKNLLMTNFASEKTSLPWDASKFANTPVVLMVSGSVIG